MPFLEKSNWVVLVVAVPTLLIYLALVVPQVLSEPVAEIPWVEPMILAIVGFVVANILGNVVFAALNPREAELNDQRDQEIDRFGERVGNWLIVAGAIAALILAMARADHFWIADHRSPDTVSRQHLRRVNVGLSEAEAKSEHWYREIFIHSEIYRRLPDVGAVVHTHAPHSIALGTLSGADRVRPTTNPGANLGAFIPIYPQTGLIETPENAQKLAGTLQGQNGVLLRGHGAVVVGGTLEQAVLRAIYLELEARYQLMARAAGVPLFYGPEETARFSKTTAVEHAWDYYVEKVQALLPPKGQ